MTITQIKKARNDNIKALVFDIDYSVLTEFEKQQIDIINSAVKAIIDNKESNDEVFNIVKKKKEV